MPTSLESDLAVTLGGGEPRLQLRSRGVALGLRSLAVAARLRSTARRIRRVERVDRGVLWGVS